MKKLVLGILGIALGVMAGSMNVCAQTPDENRLLVFMDAGRLIGISDNAKWAVGYLSHEMGFLVNLETETVMELTSDQVNFSEARDVSDDGIAVGTANGFPAYWTSDGEYHSLPLPPGNYSEGTVAGITPDARVISGYVAGTGFRGVPLRWLRQEDGSYNVEKLQVLDKDLFGKRPLGGFYVDAMSSDGTMIAGRMCDNEYGWFTAIWKNVEETPLPVIVGQEFQKSEDGYWTGWNASPNLFTSDGKYLIGVMEDNTEAFGPTYALKYDIEKDEMTLPEITGDLFCLLKADGTMISASPAGFPYRSAFIDLPGQAGMPLEQYAKEHFGVDMLEQLDGSGTPMAISADEKSMVGFAGYNGTTMVGYCLRLANDVTAVHAEKVEKPTVFTAADGTITIKGAKGAKVTLSDLTGRIIDSRDVDGETVMLSGEKGSVYLVKVAFDKVSYLTKVIVN